MFKRFAACAMALAISILAFPTTFFAQAGPTVNVWVSQVNEQNNGMAKGLQPQAAVQFVQDDDATVSNLITVEENNTYQTMDGFGASITEASAHLYQTSLSAQDKTAMMNALFDKETGIGISMLRQPIGATDHCVAPYNYCKRRFGYNKSVRNCLSTE